MNDVRESNNCVSHYFDHFLMHEKESCSISFRGEVDKITFVSHLIKTN